MDKVIKLAVGMLHSGTIKTRTVISLLRMCKGLPFEYNCFFQEGSVLHQNRERLAQKAADGGFTHLLFVDSDMTFEPDAILKLLAREKDIIGTHYNCRALPLKTTVELKAGQTELKELDTCNALGAGFLLIKTEVFKKLSHPWFFWEVNEKGETTLGEDHWFCKKAREAGYEIFVDISIPIGHEGSYVY